MANTAVIRKFSGASTTYEQNCIVQRDCAQDMLDILDIREPKSILEVGCGTGLLTRMLASRYPNSQILASDPSQKMLDEAKKSSICAKIDYDCRAAHNLRDGAWDLIASNAALHWAGTPERVIELLKNRLSSNGALAFTYFTRNTYPELAHALSHAAGFWIELAGARFDSAADVERAVSNYFTDVRILRKTYRSNFSDVRSLLQHIKLTGTRGNGEHPKLPWTKGLLERTQREYIARYGEVQASSEVIICVAKQRQSS